MAEKSCSECGGKSFRIVNDEWMKRTFLFVENGTLEMCDGCGAKFLICKECDVSTTNTSVLCDTCTETNKGGRMDLEAIKREFGEHKYI